MHTAHQSILLLHKRRSALPSKLVKALCRMLQVLHVQQQVLACARQPTRLGINITL